MYMIWWKIGLAFSTVKFWPNAKKIKEAMGLS
jgi:hypothetical protein